VFLRTNANERSSGAVFFVAALFVDSLEAVFFVPIAIAGYLGHEFLRKITNQKLFFGL
jgi:hypothetical protein